MIELILGLCIVFGIFIGFAIGNCNNKPDQDTIDRMKHNF